MVVLLSRAVVEVVVLWPVVVEYCLVAVALAGVALVAGALVVGIAGVQVAWEGPGAKVATQAIEARQEVQGVEQGGRGAGVGVLGGRGAVQVLLAQRAQQAAAQLEVRRQAMSRELVGWLQQEACRLVWYLARLPVVATAYWLAEACGVGLASGWVKEGGGAGQRAARVAWLGLQVAAFGAQGPCEVHGGLQAEET